MSYFIAVNFILGQGLEFLKLRNKGFRSGKMMGRRKFNTGVFSHLAVPMQIRSVKKVAKRYKIKISDIKITIIKDSALLKTDFTGRAEKNWVFLFPNAFTSEEELARTLFHERIHVLQYREHGVAYVQNNREWFEDEAYESENEKFGKKR